MKKKSIFNSAFLRAFKKATVSALALSILATTAPVGQANDPTPPITVNTTFTEDGNPGYMDAKTSVLSTGRNVTATVRITPQYQTGYAKGTKVHIYLPSYDVVNGEAKPIEPNQKPTAVGIRGELVVGDDWRIIGNQAQNGGWLSVEYIGQVNGGANQAFNLLLSQYGDGTTGPYGNIPEGTVSTVYGYAEYASFNDEPDTSWVTPAKSDLNSIVNLITSNLTWSTSIDVFAPEKGIAITPWDRYNYGSYDISVVNTSENPASVIKGYRVAFDIDSTLTSYNGVLPRDVSKWIYNGPGVEPTLNLDNDGHLAEQFVGVEGEGGVIIYDITDWDGEGDVNEFIETNNLNPLPYTYSSGGMIMVDRVEGEDNEWIYPEANAAEDPANRKSSKRFLMKVPFAAEGFKALPVSHKTMLTTEVQFAQNRFWTKSDSANRELVNPIDKITVKKNAGTPSIIYSNEGYYTINGLANQGNRPVFNYEIVDKLPSSGFVFNKFVIRINENEKFTAEELFVKWLDKNNVLETYQTYYIGNAAYQEYKPVSNDGFVYSLDAEKGQHVWTMDVTPYTSNSHFLKQFKINLTERIAERTNIPVTFEVHGKATSTTTITNNISATAVGKWLISENDEPKEYKETNIGPVNSSANINVILPAKVVPNENIVSHYGTTNSSSISFPHLSDAAMSLEMGNNSDSKSPLATYVVTINNDAENEGIKVNDLIINEAFMNTGKNQTIAISNKDGSSSILITADVDGNLVYNDTLLTKNDLGQFVITKDMIDVVGVVSTITFTSEDFQTKGSARVVVAKVNASSTADMGEKTTINGKLSLVEPEPYTGTLTDTSSNTWSVQLPAKVVPNENISSKYGSTTSSSITLPYERNGLLTFEMGNNSEAISPEANYVITINSNADGRGVRIEDMLINPEFLQYGKEQSITLSNKDKTKVVVISLNDDGNLAYKGVKLATNDDGKYIIPNSIINEVGYVSEVVFNAKEYITKGLSRVVVATANAKATGDMGGSTTISGKLSLVQNYPFTGVLTDTSSNTWYIARPQTTVDIQAAHRIFSTTSTTTWDDYVYAYYGSPYHVGDYTLDMPYKSMGSFLVSVNRPNGAAYNSKTTSVLTTTFPEEQFDMYYMKVDKVTKQFISTIDIYRNVDGEETLWQTVYGDAHPTEASEWVSNGKAQNRTITDKYFRIATASADNDKTNMFETYEDTSSNHAYYKLPYDDDSVPSSPVTKVVVTYKYNQDESKHLENTELAGSHSHVLEFTGRFHTISNTSTKATNVEVVDTVGDEKTFDFKDTDAIYSAVHSGTVTVDAGAHVNMSTDSHTVEMGDIGEYLMSFTNTGSLNTSVSTNWNEFGRNYGNKSYFFDNMIVNFNMPTKTPNTDTTYNFDAKYFIINNTMKNKLDKLEIVYSDGNSIDLDMSSQPSGDQRVEIKYGESADLEFDNEGVLVAVVVPNGQDITTLKFHIGQLNGVGDRTAEIEGVSADSHDTVSTIDLRVGGIVNGNQAIPANTTYSRENGYDNQPTNEAGKQIAYLTGKTLTMGAAIDIFRADSNSNFIDFGADTITPNVINFGVNLWNNREEVLDSAAIYLRPVGTFRMQKFSIPAELYDGEQWQIGSVNVVQGSKDIDSPDALDIKDYFKYNPDTNRYEILIEDLFDAGILTSTTTKASYEPKADLLVKDVRVVKLSFVAKDGHVLEGSYDALTEDDKQLSALYNDVEYSGIYVDAAVSDNGFGEFSRPTVRHTSGSQTHTVSGFVKSPNPLVSQTSPRPSDTYSHSVSNRKTVANAEMWFGGSSNTYALYDVTKDGITVPYNHVLPEDRLDTIVMMQNTGSQATSDFASGDLKLVNPHFRLTIPKGMRLLSWSLVTDPSDVADELSDKVIDLESSVSQSNVTLKFGDISIEPGVELSYEDTVSLKNAIIEFNNTTIDYGKRVYLDLKYEIVNEFGDASSVQGKAMQFNMYARPGFKHSYNSYAMNEGADHGIATSTYTANYTWTPDSVAYAYLTHTQIVMANPNEARISTSFDVENVSGKDMTMTIGNLIQDSFHDNTNYEVVVTLDAGNRQGLILNQWPTPTYPEGYVGDFDTPELYYMNADGEWVLVDDLTIVDEELFNTVNKIKFNYGKLTSVYGDKQTQMPNVEISAKGYWRNVNNPLALTYTISSRVDINYGHEHLDGEEYNATLTNNATTSMTVLKGMSKIEFDVQAFGTKDEALAPHDANASLKIEYRPNEKFWYKITAENIKKAENINGTDAFGTSPLDNPVIIDKLPEYLLVDMMNFSYEQDGKTLINVQDALDAGVLDIKWFEKIDSEFSEKEYVLPIVEITEMTGKDIGGAQQFDGGALTSDGNGKLSSTQPVNTDKNPADEIKFNVIKYTFENGQNVKLERGDKIEIAYSVQARNNDLPMATYSQDGRNVYAPFFGWYGNNAPTANHTTLLNETMSMDSILHDAGITGDKTEEQDPREFLTNSTTWLHGQDESGGNYYDGSARISVRHKVVMLNGENDLMRNSSQSYQSDSWNLLLEGRVNDGQDWSNDEGTERILWSQSAVRLPKAWIAGNSEFFAGPEHSTMSLYSESNFYEHDKNLADSAAHYSGRSKYHYDAYTPALEFKEEYKTRLNAFNYGDWGVSGIEFIYVMPANTAPVFNDDGTITMNAAIGGLPTENVSYEIIQTPTSPSKDGAYLAPNSLKEGRQALDASEYYSASEVLPYVIKVVVSEDLGKWFNRLDSSDKSYQMSVEFASVVTETNMEVNDNEGSMWFDQLYISPVLDGTNDLYYQIYSEKYGNFTRSGFSAAYSPLYFGNDAMVDGQDVPVSYIQTGKYTSNNFKFEPYQDYARGLNTKAQKVTQAQVNELTAQSINLGNETLGYSMGGKTVEKTYATHGTQAKERVPMIRNYVKPGNGTNSDYIVDLYETFTMNFNAENIQIESYNTHHRSTSGYGTYQYNDAMIYSTQTSGGARGTWFEPVMTVVLPYGVVPVDANGVPYSIDGLLTRNDRGLSYELTHNKLTATTSELIGDVKDKFDVDVSFITDDVNGNKVIRYVLTFTAKTSEKWDEQFDVAFGEGLTISPLVKTVDLPEGINADGKEDASLYEEYEETYFFSSSLRKKFQPLVEQRLQSGTFWDSTATSNGGGSIRTNESKRRDSVSVYGNVTLTERNPFRASQVYNETDSINLNRNNTKLEAKTLSQEFMSMLNGHEGTTYEENGVEITSQGVVASGRLFTRRPRLESSTHTQYRLNLAPETNTAGILVGSSDRYWYGVKVSNKPSQNNNTFSGISQSGDIHHSQILVSAWLPEYASHTGQIVLEVDGEQIQYKDLESRGYSIEVVNDNTQKSETKNGKQLISFVITTPANEDRPNTKGSFKSGESFTLLFEAALTSGKDSGLEDPSKPWTGDDLRAHMYVSLINTDGSFNTAPYDDILVEQHDKSLTYATRQDDSENSTSELGGDFNLDGDYVDTYTTSSVLIRINKPYGFIRKNMVKPRELFTGGQIGDPYFSSADDIEYIISEVSNIGSSLPRLIVEDILPTYEDTSVPYKVSDAKISTLIQTISTGNWLLPQSYIDRFPDVEDLNEEYRVYVYVSHDVGTEVYDRNEASWTLLNPDGAALDANEIISLDKNQEGDKQIKRIRWVVESSDPTEYLIPAGFRLNVDANPATSKAEEVSEIDPNNDATRILPSSVVDNAPKVVMKAQTVNAATTFIYNKADLWAEYNIDMFALMSSSTTRAYLTPSRPIVDIIFDTNYFRYDNNRETDEKFAWDDVLLVNPNVSPYMKYSADIINADKSMWSEAENARYTEDTYIDPVVVFELPSNFSVDRDAFTYVPADQIDENHPLHADYTSTGSLREATQSNLWTWKLVRKDGAVDTLSEIKLDEAFVSNPYVGSHPGVAQNIIRINFKGTMYPGDRIVVEFIGKVTEYDPSAAVSNLQAKVSAFNNTGMMNPLNTELILDRLLGYNVDSKDLNNNGRINDRVVSAQSQYFEFVGYNDFPKKKIAISELALAGTQEPYATPVPEGKSYKFETSMSNPNPPTSKGYKFPILLDILPHEGDESVTGYTLNGQFVTAKRNSKWSGILDATSFDVKLSTKQGTSVIPANQYDIYVGPFKKNGSEIEVLSMSEVPNAVSRSDGKTYETYMNDTASREKFMVKLADVVALKSSNPEKYNALMKEVKVIAMMYKDKNKMLEPETRIVMSYSMLAPLNLPFFNGDAVVTENTDSKVYGEMIAPYVGWNSFAGWQDAPAYIPAESNQAGVFLNAPADRVYIGDYVWLDVNQNGLQDEATYSESENGRLLPSSFKDLDGDGIADDPGINGVKVELLTKDGFPSDINGNPVMKYRDGGVDKYVVVDTTTGQPLRGENFGELIEAGAPFSFTTTSDFYGNQGYYILSNLAPNTYKLKYTFPTAYNSFGLTTEHVHSTTDVQAYNSGDLLPELYEGQPESERTVNSLVAITDSFTLEAGKEDAHYVDFDLGVYETVQYGGLVYLEKPEEIDGYYAKNVDTLLKDYIVTLRNMDGTVAVNRRGEEMVTTSAADGSYLFKYLPIDKEFYITVTDSTGLTSKSVPVSPITHNTNPITAANDNDAFKHTTEVPETILGIQVGTKEVIEYRTNKFTTSVPKDATGAPLKNGVFYQDVKSINLGFMELNAKSVIGNMVWNDLDRDGIQDVGEPGVVGVEIELTQYILMDGEWVLNEQYTKTTTTNADGYYYFQGVSSNIFIDNEEYLVGYHVKMTEFPQGMVPTIKNQTDGYEEGILPQDADSNLSLNGTMTSELIIMSEKDDSNPLGYDTSVALPNLTIDAGLVEYNRASLSGHVFHDVDRNDLETGEVEYLAGKEMKVQVNINGTWLDVKVDENGEVVEPNSSTEDMVTYTVSTDANGYYEFNRLFIANDADGQPYEYRVVSGILKGWEHVVDYMVGDDELVDNDFQWIDGTKETMQVVSGSRKLINEINIDGSYVIYDYLNGQNRTDVDLGLIVYDMTAVIGDYVWEDEDRDGIQDADEVGVEGIKMTLLKEVDGELVEAQDINGNSVTYTDANGYYEFVVYIAGMDETADDYLIKTNYRVMLEKPSHSFLTIYHAEGAIKGEYSAFEQQMDKVLIEPEIEPEEPLEEPTEQEENTNDSNVPSEENQEIESEANNEVDNVESGDTQEDLVPVDTTVTDGDSLVDSEEQPTPETPVVPEEPQVPSEPDGTEPGQPTDETPEIETPETPEEPEVPSEPEYIYVPNNFAISDIAELTSTSAWADGIERIDFANYGFDYTLDAGLIFAETEAQIGDTVYHDIDRDGIQDDEEPGIPGIAVGLYVLNRETGEFILHETTTTDGNGNYVFNVYAMNTDENSPFYLMRNVFKVEFRYSEDYEYVGMIENLYEVLSVDVNSSISKEFTLYGHDSDFDVTGVENLETHESVYEVDLGLLFVPKTIVEQPEPEIPVEEFPPAQPDREVMPPIDGSEWDGHETETEWGLGWVGHPSTGDSFSMAMQVAIIAAAAIVIIVLNKKKEDE